MKGSGPLLAALLFAIPALAQDITDIKVDKFQRKAASLVSQDKNTAQLTPDEREFLIKAVAAKLEKIDAYNRQGGKYKEKVNGVNLKITITQTDLEELLAKHPEIKLQEKRGQVIRETETKDPAPAPTITEQPPQYHVETFASEPFHSLFKDNEWKIDPESCDTAQLAAQVDEAVKSAGPDGKIEKIYIESSASTLKNTGSAKDMTFADLSQKRAEAARDYVLDRLAKDGVKDVSPNDVEINAAGANKDGTSGPRDPYGNGGKGDGNAPLKDVAAYDQYKYVHVSLYAAKPIEEKQPPVITEGKPDAQAEVITFSLDTETRCRFLRCIKLPSFRISLGKSHKNWGSTACPKNF